MCIVWLYTCHQKWVLGHIHYPYFLPAIAANHCFHPYLQAILILLCVCVCVCACGHYVSHFLEILNKWNYVPYGFPRWLSGKESICQTGDLVGSLGQENPLEKEMATHSHIPAWETPGKKEPGRLQSLGLQRIR